MYPKFEIGNLNIIFNLFVISFGWTNIILQKFVAPLENKLVMVLWKENLIVWYFKVFL